MRLALALLQRAQQPSAPTMEIDPKARIAQMSVGEFSTFTPYPRSSEPSGFGLWRAQAGQQWHSEIQKQSLEIYPLTRNEVAIEGAIEWSGWTIQLNGRIDQLIDQEKTATLREIKTTTRPLPLTKDSIEEAFLHYCLQLLCYRELWVRSKSIKASDISMELLFVELSTGVTQTVTLGESFDDQLVQHLDTLRDFLESKRERLQKLEAVKFRPAYETPRKGQETIQEDLRSAFEKADTVCLEAPTGYGKTGVAWEFALGQLANGQVERILYLTSKSTGQIETATRLQALLDEDSNVSYWQIRNKGEHCINHEFRCSRESCEFIRDLDEKWKSKGLQDLYLFSYDSLSLDALKERGMSSQICPYESMKAALGFRDVWIGDCNYIFSPSSSRLLYEQADFRPSKTLLIIDEAHNIPSRVESNRSFRFDATSLNFLREELAELGASPRLRNSLASLIDDIAPYGKGDILSDTQLSYAQKLIEGTVQASATEALPYEDLRPETLDTLWNLASALQSLKLDDGSYLGWAYENGSIEFACLNASSFIANQISEFKKCLFLSATLHPFDAFSERCGISGRIPVPQHISPDAPWLEKAYDVGIDLRVDTRFRKRTEHLDTTASSIAKLAEDSTPAAAFFPSYAYAKQVEERLKTTHPFLRIAMQQSGQSLAQREAFIDEALRFSEVIFLILGSSFAEGVDLIGGKVDNAIVVGPALPEVNPIQDAKRKYYDRQGKSGFEYAYLQPGIQKVNQALGRLVRAPGQKAKVLLHCQRFADPNTRNLLASQYQNINYIQSDSDLDSWVRQTKSLKG